MTHWTVVDLFAGAGGLSEGFHSTEAFQTIAAVEADPSAAATYAANHLGVQVHAGDITEWLSGSVPSVDVVIGGPPCQGFSNLGLRQVRDPRNALWRRYVDALRAARPAVFVLENVADFLRSGQFQALRKETHRSGRLAGYRIEAGILNAADFGAPQLRRRAVVIGSRLEMPAVGLPVGSLSADRWATVRDAIGNLDVDPISVRLPGSGSDRSATPLPGPFRTEQLHLGRTPTPLSQARYRAIPPGGNRLDIPTELLPPCWANHRSGSGDVMGRLHWDRPSVTIRTEFWKPEKGRYLHPRAHRPITHHEAARLQGFPDNYLWYGSKAAIGRQIGNAVPIPLAADIARHLASRLS